jgi:hypothetical protein
MLNKWTWICISIILFLTIHLRILNIGEFELSLGLLILPIWLFFTFNVSLKKFNKYGFIFYIIFLILPFLNIYTVISYLDFFKSFFYYFISISTIFLFWYKRQIKVDSIYMKSFIRLLQLFLLIISTIQFYTVTLNHSNLFFNIFGNFQMKEGTFDASLAWYRVKSVYLEPSYFSFVLISLFVSDIFLRNKITLFNFILTSIMLYYSGSSFGLIIYFVLLFYWYSFVLNNRLLKYSIIFFTIFFIAINYSFLLTLTRMSEVISPDMVFNDELSSGYMRLVLPIYILSFNFSNWYLFGVPIGNLNPILKYNNFYYSDISQIHNGFFAFFIYFGITALILFLIIIITYLKSNKTIKFFIIFAILALMNSGSIFYPITYLFVFILPLTCLQIEKI